MTARTAPLALLVLLAIFVLPAFSQKQKPFTADRHLAHGLDCAACHGSGEKKPVTDLECLRCHKSIQEVAKKTADMDPNPHDNHQTMGGNCTECHKGHKQDDMYCKQCHSGMNFEHEKPLDQNSGWLGLRF